LHGPAGIEVSQPRSAPIGTCRRVHVRLAEPTSCARPRSLHGGNFTGETSQHEGHRLTSSEAQRGHTSHGRPASEQARLMHASALAWRSESGSELPSAGGCTQLHAAQPCHSAIHWAVGGLRLLGRPETRPAHITVRAGSGSLRTTGRCCIRPHDQVSQRLHGTFSLRWQPEVEAQ
jgi:hypothetical protein